MNGIQLTCHSGLSPLGVLIGLASLMPHYNHLALRYVQWPTYKISPVTGKPTTD